MPVVNDAGVLVDIYAKSDITMLAKSNAYSRLQFEDVTVGQVLALASQPSPIILGCMIDFSVAINDVELLVQELEEIILDRCWQERLRRGLTGWVDVQVRKTETGVTLIEIGDIMSMDVQRFAVVVLGGEPCILLFGSARGPRPPWREVPLDAEGLERLAVWFQEG